MKTTSTIFFLLLIILVSSCDLMDKNKQFYDVINDIKFQDDVIGLNNVHNIPVSLEIKINDSPLLEKENMLSSVDAALDSFFIVPAFSMISFYYDSLHNVNLACVKLSKKSKGTLNIPLKAFCVEGGEITYDNKVLSSRNSASYFQNNIKIEIDNVSDKTRIYYILNEKPSIFVANNTLSYLATDPVNFSHKKPDSFSCKVK